MKPGRYAGGLIPRLKLLYYIISSRSGHIYIRSQQGISQH